jgi:cell filamentation protein
MPFDPFADHATRGYLRNVAGELDPERVKRLEHRSFSANVLTALENPQGVRQLRYEDVLDTHRTLFGAVYPWAGQSSA